jgi:hypothetical protein
MLALACNPLSVRLGLRELQVSKTLLLRSTAPEEAKAFAIDFRQKAKSVLTAEIRSLFSESQQLKTAEVAHGIDTDTRVSVENEEDLDVYDEADEEVAREEHKESGGGDPVIKQVNEFFEREILWHQVLAEQGVKQEIINKIGTTEKSQKKEWHLIAQHFDVMRWWESHGSGFWPMIYGVACLILPMPESNGGQERTFSAATWMDGKLNKRQTEATFQMKVVLHQNAEFLRNTKIQFDETHSQRAAEAARSLFKLSEQWKDERREDKVRNKKEKPINYYFEHLAISEKEAVPEEQEEVMVVDNTDTSESEEEVNYRKELQLEPDSDTE